MGLLSLIYEAFAKVYERVFAFSKPTRILLVGLDAAGKTTLLYAARNSRRNSAQFGAMIPRGRRRARDSLTGTS